MSTIKPLTSHELAAVSDAILRQHHQGARDLWHGRLEGIDVRYATVDCLGFGWSVPTDAEAEWVIRRVRARLHAHQCDLLLKQMHQAHTVGDAHRLRSLGVLLSAQALEWETAGIAYELAGHALEAEQTRSEAHHSA